MGRSRFDTRVNSTDPWPLTKRCSVCGEEKFLDEFYRQVKGLYGRQALCKACDRPRTSRWHKQHVEEKRAIDFERNYGITVAEYDSLFDLQGGLCAICLRPERRRKRGGGFYHLVVDHDHATGEIRGLLCHGCNSAIGHLQDDPTVIRRAAAYLEKELNGCCTGVAAGNAHLASG